MRLGRNRGRARIHLLADTDIERQLAQHIDAVLLRHALSASGAENVLFMAAVRADVRAHVLDDAEDGHFHLLEHAQALACIEQCDVLWGRDDHGPTHRHTLRQRELRIARARRHVHDQIVEIAPARRFEQLHQRLRDHRSSPDHRLLFVHEKADRHDFDAEGFRGNHGALVGTDGTLSAQTHHARLTRAVNVRIEQPYGRTFVGKSQREIRRRRRLAHPALAGGHYDDVLDRLNGAQIALDRCRGHLPFDMHVRRTDALH